MRLGKILYLILAVLLFIFLLIPVFQNITYPSYVMYFKYMTFVSMYKIALPLAMLDWALLALYIKSLVTDISRSGAKKFDLD
jgi:hypothetical protein